MKKVQKRETVAVVGLGKIGLTMAAIYASNGFDVIGADVNQAVIESVNAGISHVKNEPGLDELVIQGHQNKQLSATLDTKTAVSQADIVVVVVPVLIYENNDVDYTYMDAAVEQIAAGLTKHTTVIFETTLPTGDTRDRFGVRLEAVSGLKAGTDFFLAYSPERVYSNKILSDLKKYPKIVGGINAESLQRASAFYKQAIQADIIEVESTETAEFAKVAECVYRDVNIALANELAVYASEKNVNIVEVIQASNTQPYSHIHSPGIGVGGHCIPIYPYFFMKRGLSEGLAHLAREVNDGMAGRAVKEIDDYMDGLKDKRVLILGLSYRENVKEETKSTTWLLVDQLKQKQADVFVHDPMFTDAETKKRALTPFSLTEEAAKEIDVIIVQAFHDEYKSLDFGWFTQCKLVFDGRNALDQHAVKKQGIAYKGLGL
ncbi:nucleotide sugar dehydrogenase [Alkalihalobacillus xiaoxiensis]|uniref:Nucleotide sugar dehydrogenase n=1 Tax=Shouchella xiaoxiensis TaxID=766895 RepID=A0ABS2SUL2_9BACI|nr:nucleotide sugar dehydrogenase [Shouchella xiaoxiensis]MBM7838861.1 nucleotide sugar dehydrogenase [Shouchella xiaoxiensis]